MQTFKDSPIWVKILIVVCTSILGLAGYIGVKPFISEVSEIQGKSDPILDSLKNINFTFHTNFLRWK